tara:strand:- start:654 stop:2006 length:1353 start_codon:yes stop_codon:yes gene_type:complete
MKKYITIYLLLLLNLCFTQNAELITQQIAIEDAIKNKVDVIINKFLQADQYITIVNARLDFKPLALEQDTDTPEQTKTESSFSPIPGLMPSIPTRESIYRNNAPTKSFSYANDKYILYQLEIIIYLDENITTGSLQNNIKALVLQNLKEIQCEDCIRFETMALANKGGSLSRDGIDKDSLRTTIELLKDQMRQGQLAIMNKQIDDLENSNSKYLDVIQEHQRHMEEQDSLRRAAEIARMERLEQNERLYRSKQDSLYILTSIKLDEAVRGRIQSEETTKKELLNLIKMQINGDDSSGGILNMSDDTQSDLFTKRPSMGRAGLSGQTWIMIVMLILLMFVLLVVIMKNKQTVYLKPKTPDNNGGNSKQASTPNPPGGQPQGEVSFSETQANQNEEVLKSELQSLRQSAVSMSVSEKAGANQIVQDWLDDGSSTEESTNDKEDAIPANEEKK